MEEEVELVCFAQSSFISKKEADAIIKQELKKEESNSDSDSSEEIILLGVSKGYSAADLVDTDSVADTASFIVESEDKSDSNESYEDDDSEELNGNNSSVTSVVKEEGLDPKKEESALKKEEEVEDTPIASRTRKQIRQPYFVPIAESKPSIRKSPSGSKPSTKKLKRRLTSNKVKRKSKRIPVDDTSVVVDTSSCAVVEANIDTKRESCLCDRCKDAFLYLSDWYHYGDVCLTDTSGL